MRTTQERIDSLTLEDLNQLLAERQGPCISIFMPIAPHRSVEIRSEPLRLTGLLQQAQAQLLSLGLRVPDIEALLAPAQLLAQNNKEFWQYQRAGLALFVAQEDFWCYRLPIAFTEQVIVDKRFQIRPLLPLLNGDGSFYILALSQNQVRLLQGAQYTVSEVALENAPHSLAEATQYDQVEPTRQMHSIASGGTGRGRRAVAFHGQGTAADEKLVKESIRHFLQQVDSAVTTQLATEKAPLLLAGVDYMCGLYREVNRYGYLMEGQIEGNPDHHSAEELHASAWQRIAPDLQKPQKAAFNLYQQFIGQGDVRALHEINSVLRAAYSQRVDTLFLPATGEQWGTFDPDTLEIALHKQAQPGDEELLNLAAVHTLRNRGLAYPMAPETMPDKAPVAALLRF